MLGNNKACSIHPIEGLKLHKVIRDLQTRHKYKQILVECGVNTTAEYYTSELDFESFPLDDD